jgi:hypothetical protein
VIEPRKEVAEADVVGKDGRQQRRNGASRKQVLPGSESRAGKRGLPRELGDLTGADTERYSGAKETKRSGGR